MSHDERSAVEVWRPSPERQAEHWLRYAVIAGHTISATVSGRSENSRCGK
jgi:hypothetical protein